MNIFRHRRNPASKFINDEYVILSKDHYLEMLYQMQSIAIEHIKMKDMVGCSNHWSFQNSFYFALACTTTVGSTIVPSTSEGNVFLLPRTNTISCCLVGMIYKQCERTSILHFLRHIWCSIVLLSYETHY